jgi:hypothetical protein
MTGLGGRLIPRKITYYDVCDHLYIELKNIRRILYQKIGLAPFQCEFHVNYVP